LYSTYTIFEAHEITQCSIDATGTPLADEALNAAKSAHAVILGAIGGPKYGTGKVRPEQGLLKLRKEMGTFGNLRPCSFASPSLTKISPLKESVCEGTDFMIVRELTGGIYFGERREADPADGADESAEDREPYSRREIERITRLAAYLALAKSPPSKVWSLDKANVLATSRLWRRVVTEVMEKEFPQLELGHHLIDSAAMLMVKNPRALNGVPDGKGLCNGIYEPIHGSAPDIAGKGIVNPVAAILSVAMLLLYSLNMPKESTLVEAAVKIVIESGVSTADIGGNASTKEVGDAVAAELEKLFHRETAE
jgi:3-isopropylmalate dehydrogenase